MPKRRAATVPRTFFLNEQHQLAPGEKQTRGGLPKLAPVDWAGKARKIRASLGEAKLAIEESRDPLRGDHYFLSAVPERNIIKVSEDKRRAPEGVVEEEVDYAGEHSLTFRRLGLDLLAVDSEGRAVVHAGAPRLGQLLTTAESLQTEGPREQARWISIDSFETVPATFRLDDAWLEEIKSELSVDTVLELQPLLSRVDVEEVMRAIIEMLESDRQKERFVRAGSDFSGRRWYRGILSPSSLIRIANEFYSVQALHRPLETPVSIVGQSPDKAPQRERSFRHSAKVSALPVVGVVDVGVPEEHKYLASFRRGRYVSPNSPTGIIASHGSRVASRVVFGDVDFSEGLGEAHPSCAFLDINVAARANLIDDKEVLPALQAVVGAFPDVRIFNLSFGDYKPLNAYSRNERREKLLLLQDLDNFVFRSDVAVIVAAGNSAPGVMPSPPYPAHVDDPTWALGSWACGFNTLTCGSYVGHLNPDGLVKDKGWPSPFSRIGPGLCSADIPEYSASGGNCTHDYQFHPGLGVWTMNEIGTWEDDIGTSLASPLLAREAAFAFQALQRRCEQGARPFAATLKAFLAITATPPVDVPERVLLLVKRTLGRGTASADRLESPSPDSALLIWQGVLRGPQDKARLQVPIPRAWLHEAEAPELRIVVAWESPVNEAVEHIWACRRVEVQLRPTASAKALPARGKRNHPSYPIVERAYNLSRAYLRERDVSPDNDIWLLEISYKEVCEYVASIDFSSHQRVGIVMELKDLGASPTSPQEAMQALPNALTMARLTIPENRVPNPVVVKVRV